MAKTTWKQVVYDTADAYREATGTTDKIPVGELANRVREGGGKEDLDTELTEQETLLSEQTALLADKAVYDVQEVTLDPVPEGSVHEFYDFVASKVTLNPYQGGEGLYVWKRSKTFAFDPVITEEDGKYIVNVTNANFDPSTVDISFYEGFSWNCYVTKSTTYTGYFTIVNVDGNWGLQWKTENICPNGVYDPVNATITFDDNAFDHTTATSQPSKTIEYGYVISDDNAAYPDNGEQDGYWYILIFDLNSLGCSDYSVSTLNLSGAAPGTSVFTHSLGKIPKVLFFYSTQASHPSTRSEFDSAFVWNPTQASSVGAGTMVLFWNASSVKQLTDVTANLTVNTVQFTNGAYLHSDYTYVLVAMA